MDLAWGKAGRPRFRASPAAPCRPSIAEDRRAFPMTAVTTAAPPADAGDVTPYARKALIASTVGYAMDGFDFLILGFMLAAIRADLGFSQAEAASLATWTLLGAVAGGIGFGILSDRLGRVRVLTWTILLFAVFTGLLRSEEH